MRRAFSAAVQKRERSCCGRARRRRGWAPRRVRRATACSRSTGGIRRGAVQRRWLNRPPRCQLVMGLVPESPQTRVEARAVLGRGCGREGRPERCSAARALHEELLAVFVLAKEGVDSAEAAAGDARAVDGHATPAPTQSSSVTPAALRVGKTGHAAEGMGLPADVALRRATRTHPAVPAAVRADAPLLRPTPPAPDSRASSWAPCPPRPRRRPCAGRPGCARSIARAPS